MSAVTAASFQSSVTASDGAPVLGEQLEDVPKPKPNVHAMDFIDMLVPNDFKNIQFADNLCTVSNNGKELGVFEVTVTPTQKFDKECYLIHANSHGSIDGVPCGTSITAYVTQSLVTLEQQHHEYVQLENHPLDRKTFLVQQQELNNYVVNRVITQGKDVQRSALTYPLSEMTGFITEGSNLLLQRLLVKKGIPEKFQLLAFDSECNLCPVHYKAIGKRVQKVNSVDLDVTGIERTIESRIDLPTTWQSYFMIDGHLTSRVQVGSPVTMKLSIAPKLIEDDEEDKKPEFPKKDLNWEEDMELTTQFKDRKDELKNDHQVYMRKHPELKSLMADFMQFLLLQKPEDTVAFAAEYFASFSDNIPDPTSYKESAFPTQFPMSRCNSKIQYLSRANTGM